MLLVAGGQLDPNIGRLLRGVLKRRRPFIELLVGPELTPRIEVGGFDGALILNGQAVNPAAAFVRHDVFLHQETGNPSAAQASLNWYYCIRGWLLVNSHIRFFNRRGNGAENNKIENLFLASDCGLPVPDTWITNDLWGKAEQLHTGKYIQKPVAGGSYTKLLGDTSVQGATGYDAYPHFVQPLLIRPELRVYSIGDRQFAFEIESSELDYRVNHSARIRLVEVPHEVQDGLRSLSNRLHLDFSAADFMLDASGGGLKFLEINTQPMFAAFDISCDGKLVDGLLDFLYP